MKTITEHEAKALLGRYGIPVTTPCLARSLDEAQRFVDGLSGPAAVKIASSKIPHKAQVGGVRLGITSTTLEEAYGAVLEAGRRVVKAEEISGVLVEAMVPSGKEIIVGAIRDPFFGPVAMIGEGGLGVEQQANVRFVLCPMDPGTARQVVRELSAAQNLKRSVEESLVQILLRIGGDDGLMFREPIAELDINPLVVGTDSVIAVDAHAVFAESDQVDGGDWAIPGSEERKRLFESIRATFEPTGIVVVGASAKPGKLGFSVIQNLIEYGFRKPLYAIHPTANSIYGCPAYPSVASLPENVDRAIVIVPAGAVVETLAACAGRGVRVAQVFSAGFSEWSDEGKVLEREVQAVVARTGMRVIGPNTIGTFSGAGKLTLTAARYSPDGPGRIAFIGQSGTYALDVISRSKVFGLPLAYSLSCGNCVDLGPVEYLAYLAEDPSIDVIAMYLESMEDAGRFFRLAREIEKPLVLLKGGRTSAGARAASSHTGALASDIRLWSAAARQAGAIVVSDINELMDVLVALAAFRGRLPGSGLGLFTSGGGVSVGAADTAAAAGMRMAELSDETRSSLAAYGVPGTSIQNPVDIPVWGLKSGDRFIFDQMIDILGTDAGVDSIIACVEMGSVFSFSRDEAAGRKEMERITESIARAKPIKPLSAVLRTTGDKLQDDFVRDARRTLGTAGIAVYPSVETAIKANAAIATATRFMGHRV